MVKFSQILNLKHPNLHAHVSIVHVEQISHYFVTFFTHLHTVWSIEFNSHKPAVILPLDRLFPYIFLIRSKFGQIRLIIGQKSHGQC